MKTLGFLILIALSFGSGRTEEPSAALIAACHDELPGDLRDAAEPGALSGKSAAGSWSVETADLNGDGSVEAFLIVLEAGRSGEVRFFAERAGKDPQRKKVSLKGRAAFVSVSFHAFDGNQRLAHVDGGDAGQRLLSWTGDKLETVWDAGKMRENESRWFELEDLDGDGLSEVITYHRRELDVFTNEDELAGTGGSDAGLTAGKVDAVGVFHFHDGKWKKDKKLLETLR